MLYQTKGRQFVCLFIYLFIEVMGGKWIKIGQTVGAGLSDRTHTGQHLPHYTHRPAPTSLHTHYLTHTQASTYSHTHTGQHLYPYTHSTAPLLLHTTHRTII